MVPMLYGKIGILKKKAEKRQELEKAALAYMLQKN